MRKSLLIGVCILMTLMAVSSQRYASSLTAWTFTIQDNPQSYPATIPSTLSLDLIDNNLINSNPYYRDNFLNFYKYETKDASYQTNFSIPSVLLSSTHQILIF